MTSVTLILSQIRKAVAALALGAAAAVSAGLLSGTVQIWVLGVLAVASAVIVYLVPNAPTAPTFDGSAVETPVPVSSAPLADVAVTPALVIPTPLPPVAGTVTGLDPPA